MKTGERNRCKDAIQKKVHERLKEKLGPGCDFGQAIYCCDPMFELIRQYTDFINKTQEDDEAVTRMLDAKDLDINKLKKENEKFLMLNGEKESW